MRALWLAGLVIVAPGCVLSPTSRTVLETGVSTLTCIGGGCEVTGELILSVGPSSTGLLVDKTKPAEIRSLAITNLFGDVLPGTYLVDLLAFGEHASVFAAQMHVLSSGVPSRAGRVGSP